jgi:hypothetical protein
VSQASLFVAVQVSAVLLVVTGMEAASTGRRDRARNSANGQVSACLCDAQRSSGALRRGHREDRGCARRRSGLERRSRKLFRCPCRMRRR